MHHFLFCLLTTAMIIAINIHRAWPSSGKQQKNSNDIDERIQKIIQKLNETDESCDAACTKQLKALIVPMLLEECQMVQSIGKVPENAAINLDEEIKGEVERNCAAIKNGKQLAIGTPELADKVGLALREYGQTMMAILEEEEKRTEITMDGMHGTMVDLLARANNPREQIRSQKLQRIVAMGNTLGALGAKMSAGPAKDAVQSLLLLSSDHSRHTTGPQPMELVLRPSDVGRLIIHLWHIHSSVGLLDQKRQDFGQARRRRTKRSVGQVEVVLFLIALLLARCLLQFLSALVEFSAGALEYERFFSVIFGFFIFAFLYQQRIYRHISDSF